MKSAFFSAIAYTVPNNRWLSVFILPFAVRSGGIESVSVRYGHSRTVDQVSIRFNCFDTISTLKTCTTIRPRSAHLPMPQPRTTACAMKRATSSPLSVVLLTLWLMKCDHTMSISIYATVFYLVPWISPHRWASLGALSDFCYFHFVSVCLYGLILWSYPCLLRFGRCWTIIVPRGKCMEKVSVLTCDHLLYEECQRLYSDCCSEILWLIAKRDVEYVSLSLYNILPHVHTRHISCLLT